MERVEIAEGLSLSRIVYGMWRLTDRGADRSEAAVRGKIDACLDQGITTFDQADIYGDYESQPALGAALKADPSLRERIEIVTKCGIKLKSAKAPDRRVKHYDTSAAHIRQSVDDALRLMGIEHIDLLLIHRPDPLMDHRETGAALDEVVAAGKVRAVGVSNFLRHDWELLQSATENALVTNQIELSLLRPDPFANGEVAFLQERGLPPMAWSPLGGGALFTDAKADLRARLAEIGAGYGVDETAVAIAWLLAHPSRVMPVVGTNDLARIRALSDATRVPLDRETWFELYERALGHAVP